MPKIIFIAPPSNETTSIEVWVDSEKRIGTLRYNRLGRFWGYYEFDSKAIGPALSSSDIEKLKRDVVAFLRNS